MLEYVGYLVEHDVIFEETDDVVEAIAHWESRRRKGRAAESKEGEGVECRHKQNQRNWTAEGRDWYHQQGKESTESDQAPSIHAAKLRKANATGHAMFAGTSWPSLCALCCDNSEEMMSVSWSS